MMGVGKRTCHSYRVSDLAPSRREGEIGTADFAYLKTSRVTSSRFSSMKRITEIQARLNARYP